MSVAVYEPEYDASLENILAQESLKWIFVGGKGGVGKTTTSCSLAAQLAKHRESVLVISTDPAHNLSDAFGIKVGRRPTLVQGFRNLYAMEIDPSMDAMEETAREVGIVTPASDPFGLGLGGEGGGLLSELSSSIPGIDEAMSFAELMRQVQAMEHSVIVFDTAPTGHTLRLIQFPSMLDKALDKLVGLKTRFGPMVDQVAGLMGMGGGQMGPDGKVMPSMQEMLMGRLEATKQIITQVNLQFKNPDHTTFICVCIPEFLSVYETERLIQELARNEIDSHNVVVNQILDATPHQDKQGGCGMCAARARIQDKYLDQIRDLYEDFHVTYVPLLTLEVRGAPAIQTFSELLVTRLFKPGKGMVEEYAKKILAAQQVSK